MQENDIKSEIAVPLKDSYFESQQKKNYSVEMILPTSQLLEEPANKLTPALVRLKSTFSTPVASKSFMDNLKTPETPYGQIFCDNPVTPQTKKNWKRYFFKSVAYTRFFNRKGGVEKNSRQMLVEEKKLSFKMSCPPSGGCQKTQDTI